MNARILIVDDEPKMAAATATALSRMGYEAETCSSGAAALDAFRRNGADAVVSDCRMPGMDGIELMRRLKAADPSLPVILVTAYADVASAVEAMRQGAFDYVVKPFDNRELRSLVERALEMIRLQRENRMLRRELGSRVKAEFVAESPAMKAVLDLADRAAASRAPVLIEGESGTGKELVARRLHYGSERVGRPWVAVNCKSFAEGVLESELFGHEKGAFTGALSSRPGCFERAHGGTLFLDEIGEVEESFQVKLLRVLQEGEVLRVGGDKPRRVDVRVVSATNCSLRDEVLAGRFREDLFFRLNVIPIRLPPLRERREDILPLADYFLTRHAAESRRELMFSTQARRRLKEHEWLGNVRELENVVERAVVLTAGDVIGPEDLLLETLGPAAGDGSVPKGTLHQSVQEAVELRIRTALKACRGRRAETARLLGIDRTTLYRLMKRHGISVD